MRGRIERLILSIERLREAIENNQQMPRKVNVTDALAMLIEVGPNATEIARRLGVNRRLLYRPEFKRFQDALEVARESIERNTFSVHGCVNNGMLEAWGKPCTDN